MCTLVLWLECIYSKDRGLNPQGGGGFLQSWGEIQGIGGLLTLMSLQKLEYSRRGCLMTLPDNGRILAEATTVHYNTLYILIHYKT